MRFIVENPIPGQIGGKVVCTCTVRLADRLTIRGVRVVNGANGKFVALPSRKLPDGTFENVIELSSDLFRQMQEDVLAALADWRPNLSPAEPWPF